jgi:hypothetical protein
MSRATLTDMGRLLGLAVVVLLGGAAGCVPATQNLQTAHYTLSHPDFWKVKKTAEKDGDVTMVVIPQYGSAVIDEGSGSMAAKGQNYDAVTADVEVRLYAWPDQGGQGDPTQQVGQLLSGDQELLLTKHAIIPDNPPECGVYPKKYTIFGVEQTPLDLVKRPGWRTILVGGRANGHLLAAVARVDYEPDQQRNCHNLSNMRVQLQNLLDGLSANAQPSAGGTPQAAGQAAGSKP